MYEKIKRRVFEIVEKAEKGDTVSKISDYVILSLIVMNVLSVFVETFTISDMFRAVLYKIEVVSVVVFFR